MRQFWGPSVQLLGSNNVVIKCAQIDFYYCQFLQQPPKVTLIPTKIRDIAIEESIILFLKTLYLKSIWKSNIWLILINNIFTFRCWLCHLIRKRAREAVCLMQSTSITSKTKEWSILQVGLIYMYLINLKLKYYYVWGLLRAL